MASILLQDPKTLDTIQFEDHPQAGAMATEYLRKGWRLADQKNISVVVDDHGSPKLKKFDDYSTFEAYMSMDPTARLATATEQGTFELAQDMPASVATALRFADTFGMGGGAAAGAAATNLITGADPRNNQMALDAAAERLGKWKYAVDAAAIGTEIGIGAALAGPAGAVGVVAAQGAKQAAKALAAQGIKFTAKELAEQAAQLTAETLTAQGIKFTAKELAEHTAQAAARELAGTVSVESAKALAAKAATSGARAAAEMGVFGLVDSAKQMAIGDPKALAEGYLATVGKNLGVYMGLGGAFGAGLPVLGAAGRVAARAGSKVVSSTLGKALPSGPMGEYVRTMLTAPARSALEAGAHLVGGPEAVGKLRSKLPPSLGEIAGKSKAEIVAMRAERRANREAGLKGRDTFLETDIQKDLVTKMQKVAEATTELHELVSSSGQRIGKVAAQADQTRFVDQAMAFQTLLDDAKAKIQHYRDLSYDPKVLNKFSNDFRVIENTLAAAARNGTLDSAEIYRVANNLKADMGNFIDPKRWRNATQTEGEVRDAMDEVTKKLRAQLEDDVLWGAKTAEQQRALNASISDKIDYQGAEAAFINRRMLTSGFEAKPVADDQAIRAFFSGEGGMAGSMRGEAYLEFLKRKETMISKALDQLTYQPQEEAMLRKLRSEVADVRKTFADKMKMAQDIRAQDILDQQGRLPGRFGAMSGIIAGGYVGNIVAGSALAGSALGAVVGVASNPGNALRIINAMQTVSERTFGGIAASARKWGESAKDVLGGELREHGAVTIARGLQRAEDEDRRRQRRDTKKALSIAERVSALANNPEALAQTLTELTGPVSNLSPEVGGHMASTLGRGVGYLDRFSAELGLRSPDGIRAARPDSTKVARYLRTAEMIENPKRAVTAMRQGTLTRDDVRAVREVWPEIYKFMVASFAERVTTHPDSLPPKQLRAMSVLLDVPFAPIMRPESVQRFQDTHATAAGQPEGGAQSGRPRGKSPARIEAQTKALSTSAQQLEARP
jgi:hypothetical protein